MLEYMYCKKTKIHGEKDKKYNTVAVWALLLAKVFPYMLAPNPDLAIHGLCWFMVGIQAAKLAPLYLSLDKTRLETGGQRRASKE
jgi:hypothetical protein